MKSYFDYISDKCFEIFVICFGIGVIFFSINIGKAISSYNEEDCFSFYKENNYILNGCGIYRDKLEGIKK